MRSSIKITYFCLFSGLALLLFQACDLNNSGQSLTNEAATGFIIKADDTQLSDQQHERYQDDAEVLALRFINAKDSTQTELPESLINSLYNGLIHVVTSDERGVDIFTTEHPVHIQKGVSARQILVFTDSTKTWLKAWEHGTTETGNPRVDELINQFHLVLIDYSPLANTLPTTMATLRAERPLNTYAVSRRLQQLDDINHASPNFLVNDGSDIRVLFFDDHLRVTFDYGFGDCMAGCIHRHLWKYNVYQNGTVEFIKEEGAPLDQ